MISKELLSEVLNIHIGLIELKPILENNKTDIGYLLKGSQNTVHEVHNNHKRINIYELAHRCKEWALKKDKYKWLFSYKAFIDCWCDIVDNHNRKNIIMSFRADTEPEAIFKACQWILEDKR